MYDDTKSNAVYRMHKDIHVTTDTHFDIALSLFKLIPRQLCRNQSSKFTTAIKPRENEVSTIDTVVVYTECTNLNSKSYWRAAFRLTVTLDHHAAQGASGEREHVSRQRRGTHEHQSQPAAHRVLDLPEHDLVPYAVHPDDALLDLRLFRPHAHVEDHPLQERAAKLVVHLRTRIRNQQENNDNEKRA